MDGFLQKTDFFFVGMECQEAQRCGRTGFMPATEKGNVTDLLRSKNISLILLLRYGFLHIHH